MRARSVIVAAVAAVAVVGGGSSATAATQPSAVPVDCTFATQIYVYGGSGGVNCDHPRYRAVLDCVENDGSVYHPVGPWVGRGQWSTTRCHEFAYQIAVAAQFG
jgi:hypothetical protein